MARHDSKCWMLEQWQWRPSARMDVSCSYRVESAFLQASLGMHPSPTRPRAAKPRPNQVFDLLNGRKKLNILEDGKKQVVVVGLKVCA